MKRDGSVLSVFVVVLLVGCVTHDAVAPSGATRSSASAGTTSAKSVSDFESAAHLFDYDATASFDVHDRVLAEFAEGTIYDLTYASTRGGRVGAYLVVPKGKGPFAPILFGHWGNGKRTAP